MQQIPTTLLRRYDLHRLIPSRFAEDEDSVLAPIADDAHHLHELFELDNASNRRLLAESDRLPGIGIDELVFGIPHFRVINAAFTYPRPEGSRFNGPERGAWYCSFELETALAEVIFHKTVEYAEINFFHDSVRYQLYLADFSSEFHDLRLFENQLLYLDPQSYQDSQLLAGQLLEAGSLGLIYPSVRKSDGANLCCFRPALVGDVRKTDRFELTWSGDKVATITKGI
ncbi:MAG: RES family NAD+ phosphorylase [Polynucleobacter sp.]|nr:RES family NAD+ phosphorylase [Polynucleobacter sp.]